MWIPASALTPRASTITRDNKSHAVTIATWVTLVVLVVAFLARQAIRFAVVRKVAIEDIFGLLATVGRSLEEPFRFANSRRYSLSVFP